RIPAEATQARQRANVTGGRPRPGRKQGSRGELRPAGQWLRVCCSLLALLANRYSSESVATPIPPTIASDSTATISPYSIVEAPELSLARRFNIDPTVARRSPLSGQFVKKG